MTQHNHSPFLCSTKVKAKMSKHINENWYPNCIGFFCSQFIFYFYFWLFSANLFSVLTVEVSKNQFTECLHLASLQFWFDRRRHCGLTNYYFNAGRSSSVPCTHSAAVPYCLLVDIRKVLSLLYLF